MAQDVLDSAYGLSIKEIVDVVVLGMGPGGEEVAGKLAEAGLQVVGIEAALVGGECPYWGCIPSKMMIRASNLLAEARRIPGMAGNSVVQPFWLPVAERIRDDATSGWDDTIAVERFQNKGGRFVRGRGHLLAADTIAVGDQLFQATKAIVIATGSSPAVPPIPGLNSTPFWTNHQAIEATQLPNSIIVLGGGAIGAELAQVYTRFGVAVTIVESSTRLLPLEEPEAGEVLEKVFRNEGINVVTGTSAVRIDFEDARFYVHLADGRLETAEQLLVATGRRVDLKTIGADALGVDPSAPAIPVDERLRVADRVWAVGDITGKGAFTHVATYQAGIIVADILGQPHPSADYRAVPRVTFTDPEVGAVGMTEKEAIAAGIDVQIGHTLVSTTARGWIHKSGNEGFIKLIVDQKRGILVGATSMGPSGGEVLGLLTLSIQAAIPVEQLRSMIYAYPTFHRGVEDAIRAIA
ncbi:MAG: NAD(P)/FAD-dependent oxidoreductase [Ilumatobacteraceae bacterium]